MPFFVRLVDKPGTGSLRQAHRDAHIAYVREHVDRFLIGGVTLDHAEGAAPNGAAYVLDFPDRAAVEAYLAGDPFVRAGLFELIEIRPYRKTLP